MVDDLPWPGADGETLCFLAEPMQERPGRTRPGLRLNVELVQARRGERMDCSFPMDRMRAIAGFERRPLKRSLDGAEEPYNLAVRRHFCYRAVSMS